MIYSIEGILVWIVTVQNCDTMKNYVLSVISTKKDTVKPEENDHSQKERNLVFNTNYPLMQVKSIAECSKRAFCNTFDLH